MQLCLDLNELVIINTRNILYDWRRLRLRLRLSFWNCIDLLLHLVLVILDLLLQTIARALNKSLDVLVVDFLSDVAHSLTRLSLNLLVAIL
jgi:hypothetical protein